MIKITSFEFVSSMILTTLWLRDNSILKNFPLKFLAIAYGLIGFYSMTSCHWQNVIETNRAYYMRISTQPGTILYFLCASSLMLILSGLT